MLGETIPRSGVTAAVFQRRAAAGASRPSSAILTPVPLAPAAARGTAAPPAHRRRLHGPAARPRIVFVVMSAVARAETVDQLAHALAPHTVLVHHDFAQTPCFALTAANVRFVPDPVRTGWARFGFVEGIFHALQHALGMLDFDYLQLLSPSCLPIKPLSDFERHVSGLEEAHFDCLDLLGDRDARMNVGYRAWTSEGSWMHRAMRRLCRIYYNGSPGRREEAGIWLRTSPGLGLGSQLAGLALGALAHPALGRHLRSQSLRQYYGSVWFGARRHIVAGMVRTWQQPGMREHFRHVRMAEEFLVPSLLMKMRPHKGPINHVIQRFDEAHPGCFGPQDLELLRQSPAFFARKFPDDPHAPVRQQVLQELLQSSAPSQYAPQGALAVA